MKKFLGNKLAISIFLFPAVVLFSVMVMYPIFQIVLKSFTEWDGVSPAIFIGLENYIQLLDDNIFYTSLWNGTLFAILQLLIQVILGTVLALAVADRSNRLTRFYRITFFIPVVLSITVVCQLWLSMLNPEAGLINRLFEMGASGLNRIFGTDFSYQQEWLSNQKTAIFVLIFTNSWQFVGYHFILILTAVKSIPEHYLEAAKIDGCSKIKTHLKITIPLMAESYKVCFVLAITGGLNAFANMYIMTSGGPGNATYTLTYLMHRSAFRLNEYGYGSAAAVVLVVQCLIVTIVINKTMAREQITY